MIRILMADDHAVVRDGLRHILERAGGFEVVGEADGGATLMPLVRATPADVLLLDLSMPGRNGLELIEQIHGIAPSLRILVLTMHGERQYAARAFKAGARGYLTKDGAGVELVAAVKKVAGGGLYVSGAMAEQFASGMMAPATDTPHDTLSDRELEVYRRIVDGQGIAEIAAALCVSPKTVSTYKSRLQEKMGLDSEAALIRYAVKRGLFGDDDL